MSILAAAVLNFVLRDLSDPRLGLLGVRDYGFMGNCRTILVITVLFVEFRAFACNFWIGASTWLISPNLSYTLLFKKN